MRARALRQSSDVKVEGPLDVDTPVPLYQQLFTSLKQRILAGEFDRHGQLPSEARLEQAYGVSRITVRRALQELEQQNLIVRHQGRPTRVTGRGTKRPGEAELEAQLAELVTGGVKSETEVLELDTIPVPTEVAARLELRPGERVQRSLRLRRSAGRPFCRSLAYVPERLATPLSRQALEAEPLLLLLLRGGVPIGRIEQTIAATPADPAIAELLGVAPGAPLLEIDRLARDPDLHPVALSLHHFRADLYRYGMSFRTGIGQVAPQLDGAIGLIGHDR